MQRAQPMIIPLVVLASLIYGAFWSGGWGSALTFLALGLSAGYTLRAWWTVPLLSTGMLLGNVARLAVHVSQSNLAIGMDDETLRLLGTVGAGLLLGHVPLTLILALPVALGVWLARRRPRHTLADWTR